MAWFLWILIFILAWLCLDLIIIVIIWGFNRIVRPRFPDWWRRTIADKDPFDD